mmetsp:Transcript_24350/g.49424  ORF Transcript_24350/g.49424 Transcript_24350/m.49424 type:complete len:161 (+) Transcript_24350:51-533(+)
MADEEVDFEETVELGDAPMETTASGGRNKKSDATGRRLKGRGTSGSDTTMQDTEKFESIEKGGSVRGPAKSVEGWLIFITGLHEETQEDDIHDKFCDFGDIKNLHLNLDRRTGFVKGYALVEYEELKQAQDAISTMNGAALMGATISVDWAFSRGPSRKR